METKFDTIQIDISEESEKQFITDYLKSELSDPAFEEFEVCLDDGKSLADSLKNAILNEFVIEVLQEYIGENGSE